MNTRVETKHLMSESTSPYIKRLVLMKRSGIPLDEKQKRKLEQFNEVVSMTEVPKFHNRMKPQTSTLKSLEDMDMDDEIDLDEILREMGYYDDEEIEIGDSDEDDVREYVSDLVRDKFHENMEDIPDLTDEELESIINELEDDDEIDELHDVKISKGYKEGRKLVDKLRRDLFRKLNDDELEDFMGVLKMSFGLK